MRVFQGALLAAALVGCNGLLGIDEATLDPDASARGGAAGSGGSTGGGGTAGSGVSACSLMAPDPCNQCVAQRCCDAYDACNDDTACKKSLSEYNVCVGVKFTNDAGGTCEESLGTSGRLAQALATLAKEPAPADAAFAKTFIGPKMPREKEVFKRPELAATLSKLRAGGPGAFYKGPLAAEIVKAVAAAGGVMTAEDLASYSVTERAPLETSHRGMRLLTMPPPSSGGVALVETLGILDALYPTLGDLPKDGATSPAYLHALAEAFKHAFADRARFLGDPDFVIVDVPKLTSAAYAADLAKRIKPGAVLPTDAYGSLGGPPAPLKDGGTTHLAVIDAAGNAVSLTTTINLSFGAKLVAGKTGILLNNEMDDFVMQVGVPNAFGLIGNEQNAVAAKKRPLSSMTPTLVMDGDKVKVVVGGAGGPTIITATTEVLLDVVDWKMDAQAAVVAPRIHDQWFPEMLGVEPAIPPATLKALERNGQKIKPVPMIGKVNVLVRTDKGIDAASEPRSPSGPAGY